MFQGQRLSRHRVVLQTVKNAPNGRGRVFLDLGQGVRYLTSSRAGEKQYLNRGQAGGVAAQRVEGISESDSERFLGVVDYHQAGQRQPGKPGTVASPQADGPPGRLQAFTELNGEPGLPRSTER